MSKNFSQFAVIGLGRFGSAVAKKLFALGKDVMVVDNDEDKINEIENEVTHAIVADASEPNVLKSIGLTKLGSTLWLGDKHIALFTVAFVDIWHFWGFVMVMFLGALQQVEPALYESARVEGANKWQEFTQITIPCIMPTITFVVVTIIMWSFLTFDYVWVMTGGGPGNASELISTLVYKNAYSRYRTGYASTICVFQSALSILAYMLLQAIKKRGWDV